ncbi:MAG: amino acid ABC transporter permease [Clostridia bacterium]|nr:amino acid ABC transporter permease [Clostridia bacterium]
MSNWDYFVEQFITYGGYKKVLNGLLITVEVAVFGLLIGILIGTIIAIIKVVPRRNVFVRTLDKIGVAYVALFRGTPMVVQLLVAYWVILPLLGWDVAAKAVAIIMFGLNSGAYVSEIMRSGIQSVDKGQMEAGRALGLSFWKTMLKIIIPQSVKNILPTLGNEFISLIKETSVLSFIAIVDLTKAFKQLGDGNYNYIIPYLMLAVVYLILVLIITALIKIIERRLRASDKR